MPCPSSFRLQKPYFKADHFNGGGSKVRQWVHDNAERFGLAFPLSNEAWHVELKGARSGGRGTGQRTFTQADAESFLTAALSLDALDVPGDTRDDEGGAFVPGDVAAGRLLDLIGEAEAGGNYNALWGRPNSEADLSTYTLDEIIRQQDRARDRGTVSTAVGKYQFLRKTLTGLKDELGLTGKERFDADFQDRLAVALLERRGWSDFKAGRISKRQFALRLAQEFASLPDPGTGRSFYHSDGINRARTKTQEVYAALGLPAFTF